MSGFGVVRRRRRAVTCVACGYSRVGIARDAPCPECRTLPATRRSFELPEAVGPGLVDGLYFVFTLVCGVIGLAAVARGLTVNSAPLAIGALVVFAQGAYLLVRRVFGTSAEGSAARTRWILAPAGVTMVSAEGVVRFTPWSHVGSVAVRPTRRGRILLFLFVAPSSGAANNDSIVVQGTRSLTPSRLGRIALGLRARGLALERAAPPTTSREPPRNELVDAVLACRRCGRPMLAADAAAGCPMCRCASLAPDERVVCGESSTQPVSIAIARRYGLTIAVSSVVMVVAATSLRVEIAVIAFFVLLTAAVGAGRHAMRLRRSFGGDHAWILRDDGIDVLDRAFTRRVFAREIAGVGIASRMGGAMVSLDDHGGETPIDRIWLKRGPSSESDIAAIRERVSRWTAATSR